MTGGISYDAAGNARNDGLAHSFTYDAEGNVLAVDGGQTASYVFDAQNRRVRVQNSSGTLEFLFDAMGRRTSTWNAANNFGIEGRIYMDGRQLAFRGGNGGETIFDGKDVLGTERLRTNYAGQMVTYGRSLAFGDGFDQGVYTPNADQDNSQFAGLDLDGETGTSHATFRQLSTTQGRWMSPDPYDGSYDHADPQSLNRYAYVRNNPLSSADPSGLRKESICAELETCGGGGGGLGLANIHASGGSNTYFGAGWDEFQSLITVSSADGDGPHSYSESSWNVTVSSDSTNTVVGTGIYSTSDGGLGGVAITSTLWGLAGGSFTFASAGRIRAPQARAGQAPILVAPTSATTQTSTPQLKKPSYSAFAGCFYNSVVHTITDEEDGRSWTAYGFMNTGAALAIKLNAFNPIGLTFVASAALMDAGAMVKANVDCTKQAGY